MLIYKALTFVNHVIGYIVAYAPATFKMLVATEFRVFCDMTVWYGEPKLRNEEGSCSAAP